MVIGHPDREGVEGGCDALMQSGPYRVAAEHTCVHSIAQQPRYPRMWERITPGLRERVQAALPGEWIQVWAPAVQLPRRRHWPQMIAAMAEAVIASVPSMPRDSERRVPVPAFGFELLARRMRDYGGRGTCTMAWLVPGNTEEYAVADIRRAIREKRRTLHR